MSFDVVKGSTLPAAVNVGDSDQVIIIQAGVTKRAQKSLISSGGGGGGGDMITAVVSVDVSSSGSSTFSAGTLISKIIALGSAGTIKIGTTVGGGEIVDDALSGSSPFVQEAVGKYFESDTTVYFTGNFSLKILVWITE
jgi:hypothetical protein